MTTKPCVVELDRVAQPGRARLRADEDEERARQQQPPLLRVGVLDDDTFERVVPLQLPDLGVQQHLDVWRPLDPVDEVARHALAEILAADDEPDLRRVACEKDRALPGRVAATDDHGGAVRAEGRLNRSRGVMDAAALEVLEARHVELPVARARREQDRAGLDALAVAEVNGVVEALLERDRDRLAGEDDRRAELPRLDRRPLRELPAGEARGEAQVVLDPGRRCRLPAGGDRFQRHRREPLRRAVDRGGETRRPGADHEQVGHRFHPPRPAQPERRCQLRVRGVPQHDLAAADHDRRLLGRDLERPQQPLGVGIVLEVDPGVGNAVAGEEVAQSPRVG